MPYSSVLLGVISNEDSTDVTLASQLNKDFLKKRDNEEDDEVAIPASTISLSSILGSDCDDTEWSLPSFLAYSF